MGAEILAYLLFGYRVLPGVVIANSLVGFFLWNNWFGNGAMGFAGHVVIGSLAPILAMMMMNYFRLSEFFKGNQLNFRRVIFLIVLTALVNSLGKFFLFMAVLEESPDPVVFLTTYLTGDI